MGDRNTERKLFRDKLLKGLDVAYEQMIVQKRKNNQKIVVHREGKIVTINPWRKTLNTNYKHQLFFYYCIFIKIFLVILPHLYYND